MKVAILTFHEGINHGAFFQAYFLQEYLKSKGCLVDILNYKNRIHKTNEQSIFLKTPNIKLLLKNILKIKNFRGDQAQKLSLRPRRLTCNHEIISAISRQYNLIIIGSDVVWEYDNAFFGADPIYFGYKLFPQDKIATYAASIGSASGSPPSYVKSNLRKFDAISVRDENTYSFAIKNTNHTISSVVDPTMLLKVDEIVDKCSIPLKKPIVQKYILVYAHTLESHIYKCMDQFATQNNLDIVVTGYDHNIKAIKRITAGPLAWISLFYHSDYVLTSTFHGVLFSIIFQKDFLVITSLSNEAKITSVLKELNLLDRLVKTSSDFTRLIQPIDWASVNKLLESKRASSCKYIEHILNPSQ
jgi:hypothetical protein